MEDREISKGLADPKRAQLLHASEAAATIAPSTLLVSARIAVNTSMAPNNATPICSFIITHPLSRLCYNMSPRPVTIDMVETTPFHMWTPLANTCSKDGGPGRVCSARGHHRQIRKTKIKGFPQEQMTLPYESKQCSNTDTPSRSYSRSELHNSAFKEVENAPCYHFPVRQAKPEVSLEA